MRFEEAMRVIQHGFKIRLSAWRDESAYLWLDFDIDEIRSSKEPSVAYRFSYDEIRSGDWEVYNDETPVTNEENLFSERMQEALENMVDALYKKILSTVPINNTDIPGTEDDDMYKSLEITFKSGETIKYGEGEWDDYAYDGKSVAVKLNGAGIGIYNFDNVFCVELKK